MSLRARGKKLLAGVETKRRHNCRLNRDKNCNCCCCRGKCEQDCDDFYAQRWRAHVEERLEAIEATIDGMLDARRPRKMGGSRA